MFFLDFFLDAFMKKKDIIFLDNFFLFRKSMFIRKNNMNAYIKDYFLFLKGSVFIFISQRSVQLQYKKDNKCLEMMEVS